MARTPEQIRDELLVLRCQVGEEAAFEALVERWQPRLYARALQLVGRPDVARDCVQETWLAIIRGLSRLEDPARFGGFAQRILARRCVDSARGQARRARVDEAERSRGARFARPTAERDSDSQRVREAIATLPSDRRTVLTLHYLRELPIAEIASRLGIPEGTVKSRLHDARERLSNVLARRKGSCHS